MVQKKYSDIYIGFSSAKYGTTIVDSREIIAHTPKDEETMSVGKYF
jgi:hypothetical protein